MSDHTDSEKIPGFFGLLWRMTLAGGLVFALGAGGGYFAVENLIRTEEVDAPDLLTLELEVAVRRSSEAGFPVRIGGNEQTLILGPGRVISQRPNPGKRMKRGGTLTITVSESPAGGIQVSSIAPGE